MTKVEGAARHVETSRRHICKPRIRQWGAGRGYSKEPHVAQPELQGYCTLRHIDFTSSFTVTKTLHENIETFPSKLKSQLDLELTGFQLKSGCICFLQNLRILTITFWFQLYYSGLPESKNWPQHFWQMHPRFTKSVYKLLRTEYTEFPVLSDKLVHYLSELVRLQ